MTNVLQKKILFVANNHYLLIVIIYLTNIYENGSETR